MGRWGRRIGSWLLMGMACGVLAACHAVTGRGDAFPGCEELGSTLLAEEDGLPIFHLFFAPSLPEEDGERQARLLYRGRCYPVEAKIRGHTSRAFPKNSYTLSFPPHELFDDPLLADGFTDRRKLVLISPFNDNSYLRSRLAFSLWNRMSPDHLQVKTASAVLYLNGEYWGLYTVADHVDGELLAAQGLDVEGDLFKAVGAEANFSRHTAEGALKASPMDGFEKKEGQPKTGPEAYASILAFTAFVADADAETFRKERISRMDERDYEDWWIFATLIDANDSVAKNAYHYRPPGADGPWRFIPWDLDTSFGQDWTTRRSAPENFSDFADRNLLFARMLADPSIAEPMRERYRALLQGELSAEAVLELIDQYARELAPAAQRDEARWGQDYRDFWRWNSRADFTTHDEEVEYLRQWVRARWQRLEHQLP
ncbi:CotH kinase family protein [Hyalangium rubrum]|uniref:CotH kinase family protein n=1 Tax=Hyalangium rubrum TaxID=3103134 RepID=A0ABU5H8S4_9BACT|nr:CotH kinase family protein [Hyalangium sp. s54d21]MDY7229522.1 CotH kinase family protein [Hyalangium sp. s54d21]